MNEPTVSEQGRADPIKMTAEVIDPPNPVLERFWVAVKRIPRYLKLLANLARDGHVPPTAKAALAVGGAYTISPIDLIPGIIPVAGQLDDLVVLLLALRTAIKSCPPEVAAEQLARAGLTAEDFDADLAAVKATAFWLAGKGIRATKALMLRGGSGVRDLWKRRSMRGISNL